MKRIYKIAGVVCAAVAAILITAVIFFIRKTNNISIVFYGLDENTVQVIQEQITALNLQTEKPLVFEVTDSSSALNAGKIKNSTLLFTVNGKAVQEVQDKALMFNDAVYESVPTSLRDSLKKRVPVLLDLLQCRKIIQNFLNFFLRKKNALNILLCVPEKMMMNFLVL